AIAANYALTDFTKEVEKSDKKAIKPILQDTKRAKRSFHEIEKEMEKLRGELESLPPDSPRRAVVLKAMEFGAGDMDLIVKRLDRSTLLIKASQSKIRDLIPKVADIQKRVEDLPSRFSSVMFW